ncbi:hypothetical protein L3X38_010994 [Prunus dulcis]|uniref:Ankyrin repeat family protein n=1 Tax=Prunus dulcis TaxID=3755 RepID=A0AAD4ZFA0_PRUDU|nr:hypothetical protein L3X38_010994 [Prunus dulcis]
MVVLRSFPAVIVEPAALISLVFTESTPPSFSLLRRPNPTPEGSGFETLSFGRFLNFNSGHFWPFFEGGDDYVEFGAPGSTDICCHCDCICCHCVSTDRPLGSWSRKVPGACFISFISGTAVSARRRHRPARTTDTTSTDASRSQPAKKNTRELCRQLKTAKVTRVTNSCINIGYDERHLAAPMAELHSCLAHDIGHVIRSHCPMKWKSWTVMPDETKTEVRGYVSTNYNLEDLDDESFAYVNRLFSERYKQWKCKLHHYFEAFDDPQTPAFVNKVKVNKGNRKKKTLLHHSGSRPFSYRMEARRQTTMVERSQLVLQESTSQLPPDTPIKSVVPPQDAGFQILTVTLNQAVGRRPGTYCRGMGNARRREPRPRSSAQSNSQVTGLTAQVATLQSQMLVILQSLAQSGIPVPHFDAPTSEPVHPEHPH